jgi:hypothetical protein
MRSRSAIMLVTLALMCTASHGRNAQPVGDATNGKRIYMADGCACVMARSARAVAERSAPCAEPSAL